MSTGPRSRWPRRGFSLVELIVVLSVAVLLTGLLLPAMAMLRENAFRVVCSSGLRQSGVGFAMFSNDFDDEMPNSYWVDREKVGEAVAPWELMGARHDHGKYDGWDGLGTLFAWGYCSTPECFYCPSHHGEHPFERYEDRWTTETKWIGSSEPIYTNYHYAGHADWKKDEIRRLDADWLVVATDGLRTKSDFNHRTGMNVLWGDGSVRWNEQVHSVVSQLPEGIDGEGALDGYENLWELVASLR
ncbi:MAG: type II secretion system protein [Planctomycetota bacterium]|jgi:prepilin-type N-terminal cleavage/methylation domain-containing protein/prepilin-type processing-associated H-X9-DG protein